MRQSKTKQTAVERALSRALDNNIGYTIQGPGSWSVDSSTHQYRYHVTESNGEWNCTCLARTYCCHIAVVQHSTGQYEAELERERERIIAAEARQWDDLKDRLGLEESELPF